MQDDPEEASTGDSAAQALGAVLGGLAGLAVTGSPEGGLVGAAASPYLTIVAKKALAELRGDSERRSAQVLAVAEEEAGVGLDEFASRILATEQTRLLAGTAIEAAMRTVNQTKIRALGRALAAGILAQDDAKIEIEQMVMAAVADMEAPHFAVMDLVTCYVPMSWAGGFQMDRYDPGMHQPPHPPSDRFSAGRRKWTEWEIVKARPAVQPVLSSILGTLQRHGLVGQADTLPETLSKFNREQNKQQGGGGSPFPPRIVSPPITWVPTELGERLLRYIEEQAESTEDDGGAV